MSAESSSPWWDEKGDALARTLSQTVQSIRNGAAHKRHVSRANAHRILYENLSDSLVPSPSAETVLERASAALSGPGLTVNCVRSIIDTATALVGARSRPKPAFLTSGGTFRERDRTTRANRLLEAIFRDGKANDVALRAFRDACIDDVGFVRVFCEDGRVRFERVDALTIAVSAVEGRNEKPRTMYLVDIVDRGMLKARFDAEGSRSALGRAIDGTDSVTWDPSDPPEWRDEGARSSDVVRVYEAWRLPSCDDGDDGRHVIATENAVLLDEPWKRQRFPIVPFRWASRVSGFWGFSLAEEVAPLQRRISRVVQRIALALDRVAVPRVFVQKGGNLAAPRLDRTIGQIVEYTGEKPIVDVGVAVGPEMFAHLQWLIQQVYDVSGVSRMGATSQKPAGLDSGAALREYNDLAADRAMAVSRAWESFHVELAQVAVDALAYDDEDDKSTGYIVSESRTETANVKWEDVAMDRDGYVIVAHPTSMLARDFATRKQEVTELVQAGLIEPESARTLLELPDLDRENDIATAPRRIVERSIDRMLRDSVYTAPDPRHDLAYAVKLSTQTVCLEELNGANPDDVGLDLVRQYGEAARRMLEQAEQAQQAAAAPAPMPAQPMSPDPIAAAQGAGGMVQ